MNIETLQPYITAIKDIVTILATAIAAFVAVSGYRTWKKQLHWKTKYELAQRLIRVTYKVRDAIQLVRSPWQTRDELYRAMKDANLEGDPFNDRLLSVRCQESLYKNRWQPVAKALRELDSLSLELEAVWGQSAAKNIKPLRECVRHLWSTTQDYVSRVIKHPTNYFEQAGGHYQSKILHGYTGEEDNPFSTEIAAAVKQIEIFLKPYLKI